MWKLPLLCWLAGCMVCLAQGSAADYERALSLPQRIEGKLWRGKFEAHWEPGGARFWYSVRTRPESR